METFSAYARNFLGGLERPDVDKITGLSPVISIEQKTTKQESLLYCGGLRQRYTIISRLLYARRKVAYSFYPFGREKW